MVADTAAVCQWPPHYQDANIVTSDNFLFDRAGWLPHLIHEGTHLLLCQIHDYVNEVAAPKYLGGTTEHKLENGVSVTANVITDLFLQAHGPNIDKWLR